MFWGDYMSEQYQEPLKGTTTVGLVFEDGVVLATEKRATMGYMIASKKAKPLQGGWEMPSRSHGS